jgi:DNA-directed RNA polymerase specialized sigma24 family protein
MSNGSPSLLELLRLCIVDPPMGPWEQLLSALADLIGSVYRSTAPARQADRLEEFRGWLPGWLVVGQRLEAAHDWLDEQIRLGTCPTETQQEQALRNYLRQTIRSGVGDFFRERVGRSTGSAGRQSLSPEVAATLETRPDRIPAADEEALKGIRTHLATLSFTLRVPFRLRYYQACGPLPPDELAWVSEQSGLPPETVSQRIRDELGRNQGTDFPLSSAFIGGLLGIPPSAEGRFNTVDQRVSRAQQAIRKRLAPHEGTS